MSTKEEAELNRLKQQILIIKNAYQEEKKKNDQLNNDLNNKDEEILNLKKDIKELTNQNVNLTKQLNELIKTKNNETINRLNKIKDQNSFTHEDFILLNSELNNKVQEMSRLHQEKDEQEMAMTLQISEFEQEILKLKELNDDKLIIANDELQIALKKIEKLEEEKANLDAKILELFAELQNNKLDINKKLIIDMFNDDNNECEDCKNKLLNTIEKLNESESRAFSYEIECRSLQKRLEFLIEKDLKNTLNENQELKTSVKNYKEQIIVMTEHIADLQIRLVNQKEEIDTLKLNSNKKVGINKYLKI